MQLFFSCLFIMLFSYLMIAVYLVINLCTLFICTSSSLYTTLTRSLSDDPGFARPDIGRFVFIVQVFDETVRFARSWMLSLLILIFLPLFIPVSVLFLIHVYQIQSLFQFILYDIMRLYVILQCSLIYYDLDL